MGIKVLVCIPSALTRSFYKATSLITMVKGLQNKQTENSNYRMMVILEIVGAAVDIPEAL